MAELREGVQLGTLGVLSTEITAQLTDGGSTAAHDG